VEDEGEDYLLFHLKETQKIGILMKSVITDYFPNATCRRDS